MTNRTQAHRVADSRYKTKRHIKPVTFNTKKADDIERLRKLEQIPDFTAPCFLSCTTKNTELKN